MNLDWIAGFYEGEGYPGYVCSSKYQKTRRLKISIVQSHFPVLHRMRRFLKRGAVYPHRAKNDIVKKWRKRAGYLCLYNHDAHWLAARLLPRMQHTGKIRQLRAAMRRWPDSRY